MTLDVNIVFTHWKTFLPPLSLFHGFLNYERKHKVELQLYVRGYYEPDLDMALSTNLILYYKNSVTGL